MGLIFLLWAVHYFLSQNVIILLSEIVFLWINIRLELSYPLRLEVGVLLVGVNCFYPVLIFCSEWLDSFNFNTWLNWLNKIFSFGLIFLWRPLTHLLSHKITEKTISFLIILHAHNIILTNCFGAVVVLHLVFTQGRSFIFGGSISIIALSWGKVM